MRKLDLLIIAIALVAGAATAWFISPAPSLEKRAMAAYQAGDYAKAVPLLKKWASQPDVRSSPNQLKLVMAYLIDAQQKLEKPSAPSTAPAIAAGTPAPAPDSSRLLAQAQQFATAQAAASDVPMGADRIPHQPMKPGELRTMTIKQIGNFDFDPSANVDPPADIKNLDGGHFRVRGFMLPLNQSLLITDFALVPSLFSCCFGQPPGPQHIITCRLPSDKAVESIVDEIEVEGVLHVHAKKSEGYTSSIFEMDVTSIKTLE